MNPSPFTCVRCSPNRLNKKDFLGHRNDENAMKGEMENGFVFR